MRACLAVARLVLFKVSVSTVIRWAKRVAESGSDHKSKDVESHKDWLMSIVAAEPDLTLEEIQGTPESGS